MKKCISAETAMFDFNEDVTSLPMSLKVGDEYRRILSVVEVDVAGCVGAKLVRIRYADSMISSSPGKYVCPADTMVMVRYG